MRRWHLPTPPDQKPWFQVHDDLAHGLNFAEFFQSSLPVVLEVGTGRGLFLLNAALSRPDRNFLGLELDYKEGRYAASRLQKRNLPNARILGGDGKQAIREFIKDGAISELHIYFPDPWWKRRHHSRRLMTPDFVSDLARILVEGGEFHFWTDVEPYFQFTTGLLTQDPRFEGLPTPAERPAEHDLDYQTNFERKKRQAGLMIYRALWRRTSVSHAVQPVVTDSE